MKKNKQGQYMLHLESSGTGSSYYESLLSCPRRHALQEAEKQQRTEHVVAGAFGIGTLFHAFGELFFTGVINTPADVRGVEFDTSNCAIEYEALEEAQRLAEAYMSRYGTPQHTGKILGVEQDFTTDEESKAIVEAAVGVKPWTGRYDYAVEMTKPAASLLQTDFGLDVEPGKRYLGDWKTESAEYQNMREKFQNRTQFKAYIAAANALAEARGEKPFAGLIADVIVKTKTPKFLKILCDAPTENEVNALHRRYEKVALYKTVLANWANASEENCFPRWGTCKYFVTSQCDRGMSEQSGLVSIDEVLNLARAAQRKDSSALETEKTKAKTKAKRKA